MRRDRGRGKAERRRREEASTVGLISGFVEAYPSDDARRDLERLVREGEERLEHVDRCDAFVDGLGCRVWGVRSRVWGVGRRV